MIYQNLESLTLGEINIKWKKARNENIVTVDDIVNVYGINPNDENTYGLILLGFIFAIFSILIVIYAFWWSFLFVPFFCVTLFYARRHRIAFLIRSPGNYIHKLFSLSDIFRMIDYLVGQKRI